MNSTGLIDQQQARSVEGYQIRVNQPVSQLSGLVKAPLQIPRADQLTGDQRASSRYQ